MARRPKSALLALLLLVSACGGGSDDYERAASALCRDFNDDAFAGNVAPERARALYARLGDGFERLSPPDDLRRTHEVVLGFARGGERLFSGAGAKGPNADLRLTVGDWEKDVPRVERDLPACADSLTGTHPEIQVIR